MTKAPRRRHAGIPVRRRGARIPIRVAPPQRYVNGVPPDTVSGSNGMAHVFVVGATARDRAAAIGRLNLPAPPLVAVDAHRRRGGPYTLGATIAAALVPVASPDLLAAHDVAIRAIAPDVRAGTPALRPTLDSAVPCEERSRIPGRGRTLRLANGLADLLLAVLHDTAGASAGGSATLIADNVHHADATDVELLAVLLRRIPPSLLTVVVGCGAEGVPAGLEPAVSAGLRVVAGPAEVTGAVEASDEDLAAAFVRSDGTEDDPVVLAAYERVDATIRARLHDERADALAASGTIAARLGPVPYHRERGSDPEGAGVAALRFALRHCSEAGFHHAVVDIGERGRRLAGPRTAFEPWWDFTERAAMSLLALSREREAQRLFDEARRATADPVVHATAAYGSAMICIRPGDPRRRDLELGLAWTNTAIALSSLLPDRAERAIRYADHLNARALAEVRFGRPADAFRLVDEAIAITDGALPTGREPVRRNTLRANRAQLNAQLGRYEAALADLDAVIAADPNFPDHHLDRGNVLARMGRLDEAIAAYDTAIAIGPPFPEAHYNRADLRAERGDFDRALADLDRALELDPSFANVYTNRAGLRYATGDAAGARADVERGLDLNPADPYLLCVLGQLELDDGAVEAAGAAFGSALAHTPDLAAAWAGRGMVRYATGDHEGAVADLTCALELGEDAALRYNRAKALHGLGRVDRAIDDLRVARELDPADEEIAAVLDDWTGRTALTVANAEEKR